MKKFIIKTSHWLRGGKANSKLRNEAGNMCCLGHLAKACDATNSQIQYHALPKSAISVNWPDGLIKANGEHTLLCSQIIITNDDPSLSPKERKSRLTKLFAQIKLKPIFK